MFVVRCWTATDSESPRAGCERRFRIAASPSFMPRGPIEALVAGIQSELARLGLDQRYPVSAGSVYQLL